MPDDNLTITGATRTTTETQHNPITHKAIACHLTGEHTRH
jgi:hypothetical protein